MPYTLYEPHLSTPVSADSVPSRSVRRVCMLAYAFYESDTRIMQYAAALVDRGDAVDVIALSRSNAMPAHEIIGGVHVYRIQTRKVNEKGLLAYVWRILRFGMRAARMLRRMQKQQRYDLIHVHNVPDCLVFAAAYPKWKKVPVILDIHDLLPEFYASKFKIQRDSVLFKVLTVVERCSAAFANHVIVANDLWCNRLAARSSTAAKCSVVRNRPDLAIFRGRTAGQHKPEGKFLLTYPGSLNWHQGLDVAIAAFTKVAPQMPDAEFHIYGEGAAKLSLMELVRNLGMQCQIFFHDMLPSKDVAEVMAITDLAIEPKRAGSKFGNEALSTKILEFMTLGVPVIASRTTIHAYYYNDSIIQYYDDDDADELAAQIVRLKGDPALRRSIAERAKCYADENSWDARKGEYLRLVDTLTTATIGNAVAR